MPQAMRVTAPAAPAAAPTRRLWSPASALLVIAVAAAIAYAPSFVVPFQFDDEARLTHDVALQQGEFLPALWWMGNSRIVPSATLVLNYRLGGYEPFGYHIGNFAVHLLTAGGVFALALVLCRTPRLSAAWPPSRALLLATAAGLVVACHPLQTQAVTYIIQRYASMAALFYVWAVVCFLHARLRARGLQPGSPRPYLVATAALAIAGVLSKENTVSLPAALLLAEWIGFGRPQGWRVLLVAGGVALVIIAVPLLWKTAIWQPGWTVTSPSDVPWLQRLIRGTFQTQFSRSRGAGPSSVEYLLTEATVLPRYFRLVVLPWGLNVDHDVPIVHELSGRVLASMAALAALAGFGATQTRRRPLLAFGILWVFVTLSVESSVIPIDDPMMEHRMYLPMAGLAVAIASLFAAAVARAPRTALLGGTAVAAALIALTFARNVVWLSPRTLWLDATEKSPNKARPHVNLGAAYHKDDQLDAAVAQYCRALALDPNASVAHDNLELALTELGTYDHVEPEVVERRPNGSVVLALPDAVSFCPR